MKKIYKIIIAILIGFLIAMCLMAIDIYFGYLNAYKLNVDTYDVSLLGINIYRINIYKLNLKGDVYEGQPIGIHMGIVSMIFIIIAILVETFMIKFKAHNIKRKNKAEGNKG